MYRLVHYWNFTYPDLFNRLTHDLILLINTRTYINRASCYTHLFSVLATNWMVHVVRKLAEDLGLEGGELAKKCEEFKRKNRSVLGERR